MATAFESNEIRILWNVTLIWKDE